MHILSTFLISTQGLGSGLELLGLPFHHCARLVSVFTRKYHSIINFKHTLTACKRVSITSSNIYKLEIALEHSIGTGISMAKSYNLTRFCSVIYSTVENHTLNKCDYSTTFNHNYLCKLILFMKDL